MSKQSLALAYAMKRKSKVSQPVQQEPEESLEDLFADMPDEELRTETPEETGLVEEPGPSILERIMSKRL